MTGPGADWHGSTMPSIPASEPAGPPPGVETPVIETRVLTKVYPGQITALDGLTVSVGPGVTGLVGANGAGKSTLIKILLGLIPPTSPVTPGATVTVSPSSAVTFPGYTMVSALVSTTALPTASLTAASGGSDGPGAWVGGMVLPCQQAGGRVISR